MENISEAVPLAEDFRHPALVVFYITVFFLAYLPIAVFDVLMMLFLCRGSVAIDLPVRMVLGCLFLSSLVVTLAFLLENLTAFILALVEVSSPPPLAWCSFIVYLIGAGGSGRFVFAATFAVIVYITIRYSSSAIRTRWVVACSAVLMVACAISAGPILSPFVIEVTFFDGVVCIIGPSGENFTNAFHIHVANRTFAGLWLSLFGMIPFVIALFLPFVTLWVYYHNKALKNVDLKKCFLKLTFFLILESIANLFVLVVPTVAAYFYDKSKDELGVFLFIDIITIFSLLLTPVGVMVFLKRVRHGMKSFYCRKCCSVNDSDSPYATMHYTQWQEQEDPPQ